MAGFQMTEVETQQVKGTAEKLETVTKSIKKAAGISLELGSPKDMLSDLGDNLLIGLTAYWKGPAQKQFILQYHKLRKDFKQYAEDLEAFNTLLSAANPAYGTADANVQKIAFNLND